ncbi:TonB-dependent receptor plug domain-containing protein [Rhizobium daejeonense]
MLYKFRKPHRALVLVLLVSASYAQLPLYAASAQDSSTEDDTASSNSSTVLAPITVTGKKTGRPSATEPMGATFAEPESAHQASQTVSVVERSWIDTTTPKSTVDILADVPGVTISRNGGLGGQIYLRGFNSNDWRSSFYIDGNRFRGRNTLQYMLIAPEEIERVEVIRGPASLLYGSDALTGVVNVITRQPDYDTSGDWRIAGGGSSVSYNSNGNGLVGSQDLTIVGHDFDITGTLTGRRSSDYESHAGTVENSDYKALGGSMVVGYTPVEGQRLEFVYRDQYVESGRAGGVGGVPGAPYRAAREDPLQVHMGRVNYSGDFTDGLFDHIEASAYVDKFYTELEVQANNFNSAGQLTRNTATRNYVVDPTVIGGNVKGSIPWEQGEWGTGKTTVGLDWMHESRSGGESSSVVTNYNPSTGAVTSTTSTARTKSSPDTTQANIGAFMLNEWTPVDPLTISLGGRYDWYRTTSDLSPLPSALLPYFEDNNMSTNSALTGGAGFVYRLTPEFDLIGNIGTSYREPQNSEMFAFTNGATLTIPNPELKPEEGVSYELGAAWHSGDVGIQVTGFHNRYRNLIVTAQNVLYEGARVNQRQNVGNAEITGVEAEMRWQATDSINIFGKISTLHATDVDTNQTLPYIAPVTGSIGLQYSPPDSGYSLIANAEWAGDKHHITSSEYPTDGYIVANLYGRFDLEKMISENYKGTTLTFGIENIFDTEYVSPSTTVSVASARSMYNPLVEPGRSFSLKLEHRF